MIHPDHLGSTNIITDQDGKIIDEITYYPYGKTRYQKSRQNLTNYQHTGHEFEPEIDLINNKARMRDTVTGRFISPDPYYANADLLNNTEQVKLLTFPQKNNL